MSTNREMYVKIVLDKTHLNITMENLIKMLYIEFSITLKGSSRPREFFQTFTTTNSKFNTLKFRECFYVLITISIAHKHANTFVDRSWKKQPKDCDKLNEYKEPS